MHVRVGRHPSFRTEVHVAADLEVKRPVLRLDIELLTNRLKLETLTGFDVDFADRQLDFEFAVDISVRTFAQPEIGAVVFEPRGIHLAAMAVWGDVAAVFRAERQAHGRGPARGRIEDAAANPGLLALQYLNLGRAVLARRKWLSLHN